MTIKLANQNTEIYFVHGSPLSMFNFATSVNYYDTNQYIDSAIGYMNPNAPATKTPPQQQGCTTTLASLLSCL